MADISINDADDWTDEEFWEGMIDIFENDLYDDWVQFNFVGDDIGYDA